MKRRMKGGKSRQKQFDDKLPIGEKKRWEERGKIKIEERKGN